MVTELTADKRKRINKLGFKLFVGSFFNGVYHAAMLVLVNFITLLAIKLLELPDWTMYLAAFVAGVIIFNQMFKATRESQAKFVEEAKKIAEEA